MIRAWIVLVLALALLVGAGAVLDRSGKSSDPAVEKLVAEGPPAGEKLAAITIELPGPPGPRGTVRLYARKQGLWRSRDAHGAVCEAAALEGLYRSFLEARGVARTEDRARAREYGLGDDEKLVIAFHGPKVLEAADRDLILAFEIGRSFAEGPRGRCFARRVGSDRILEIDRDPSAEMRAPADGLPPFVDTHLLAGSTSEYFRGFQEFRIEPIAGSALRIANADTGWYVEREGGRENVIAWRVGGYMGLWLRGRFTAVESPTRARELGLDPPATRIVLVPDDGEPIEILVSAPDAGRRVYVWNRRTNVVAVVPAELEPLLAPTAEPFLDAARANPWEAWLRKP